MWFVLVLGFIFLVSLVPSVEHQFEQAVEGISGAITKGPTKTVVNAWVEVAVITAALGFGVWILEAKVAKKQFGQDVAAPGVESIHVPQPPNLGSSSGYSAGPGGITAHGGVASSMGGSPQVHVSEAPMSAQRGPTRTENRSKRAAERRTQEAHDLSIRERKVALNQKSSGYSTGNSRRRAA